MKIENVELIKYTKEEERLNVITHLLGLAIPLLIFSQCLPLALRAGNRLYIFCAAVYSLGMTLMFIASSVYHAFREEKGKKILRVIDHSSVFIAVAGTVTGCVPAVFAAGFAINAVLMLITAWTSVLAGLFITVFAFGKYKVLRMCLYILSAAVCAILGARTYFHLPPGAFLCFVFGSASLLAGCAVLRFKAGREYMHTVFHVLVTAGLFIFYFGIYKYVFYTIK